MTGTFHNSRLWLDGCLDFFHYGHSNAILQAKQLGDQLVVGVHSDEEITLHKGPPVQNLSERCLAAITCKWVNEVVPYAPYVFDLAWMRKYDCQFVVHGDDISTDAEGNDCYRHAKAANQYLEVKRTQGVSTTELLDRLLNSLPLSTYTISPSNIRTYEPLLKRFASAPNGTDPYTNIFIQSSNGPEELVSGIFSDKVKLRKSAIYLDGDWSLFTGTHMTALKACAEAFPDLPIVVGVFSDDKCSEKPVLNLLERTLNLLQCKYVSAVIIDPPSARSFDTLKYLKAKFDGLIDNFSYPKFSVKEQATFQVTLNRKPTDSFQILDKQGSDTIKQRIVSRKHEYEERQRRKLNKNGTENTTIRACVAS
ncbi:ethanolamine-phosphate cytidylyltransferase [Schizosaccharomyces cryophilus OY26]|uniref:ethanolamine-phosphate cytidylyltransferase n=1 Tax=Schizosaccharomyces cryophilus (strain OY26 / ATCC MYA-4695 / CBS 11777 / NBRC 106824 / NRRL Y48691) TaxID=653667 RepID=S9X7F1_SCHCR|nr:ethanolamine-phosphate cytidylyltransferase [Schizosaccharomyces cryophilus OY26]EPY53017.1 ethanolamine-phosphate cytidylyltransferase [Schizosaccharomyces cryophilus OY26]